jgi:hypothetical protein
VPVENEAKKRYRFHCSLAFSLLVFLLTNSTHLFTLQALGLAHSCCFGCLLLSERVCCGECQNDLKKQPTNQTKKKQRRNKGETKKQRGKRQKAKAKKQNKKQKTKNKKQKTKNKKQKTKNKNKNKKKRKLKWNEYVMNMRCNVKLI